MRRSVRRVPVAIWASAGFVVAAVALATGGTLVAAASSASADIISSGGVLSLDAAPEVLSDDTMAPGDHIYWPISANLNASTPGTLTLRITSSQALATNPGGLRLVLTSCPDAWTIPGGGAAPTCDGGAGTTIIADTAFANISASRHWQLGSMAAVSNLPMIATIYLPDSVPEELQGTHGTLNFGFTALGDTENANPSDPALPTTGVDALGPALLGFGLLLAGVTLGRLRVLARAKQQGAVA